MFKQILTRFKKSCHIGPLSRIKRRLKAFFLKLKASIYYQLKPPAPHPCNGDEQRYPEKIGSFSKALPHNELGEVDLNAYEKYTQALKSGHPHAFEELMLGGERKLVNPQAAFAYEMVGSDSHQLTTAPAPAFSSAEAAAEMVELYWQALTRDVPFSHYETNPLTIAAAEELSGLIDYEGPKVNGKVTPSVLFRGNNAGALTGPYISQFLWKDIPYVGTSITQRYQSPVAGNDHLVTYSDWLSVQNGSPPPTPNIFEKTRHYLRNTRDLGEYVHRDVSIEDGLTPALILLSYGDEALDKANPYLHSKTQIGFSTFGAPHIVDFVSRAARPALEAAWFQKWLVHRRLRPEEFGGRIHNQLKGHAEYPIHPQVLQSEAVACTFASHGTYLLPQAYEEGCPTHPSYPAGHGTFIGAMVTMLKAFFDESFVIPDPVVASCDGLSLERYHGPELTVGGELNKLAFNIAIGRNGAGVHYPSEGINSLLLGEQIAIGILRDYKSTYNEEFEGFSLTTFSGSTIIV